MKSVIFILALVGASVAAPQQKQRNSDQDTVITRSEFDNNGQNFNWVSELSDGFSHQQSGTLKQIGDEQRIVITGSYSYVAPDGQVIKVDYVADETGFHPVGDHIPKALGGGGDLPVRAARPAATRAGAKRF